jgi:Protein of unknown function (DUF4058)
MCPELLAVTNLESSVRTTGRQESESDIRPIMTRTSPRWQRRHPALAERSRFAKLSQHRYNDTDTESTAEDAMPVHDWSRSPAGLFHHFHQCWAVAVCDALNAERLPKGYFALLERHAAHAIPDVIALERGPKPRELSDQSGGIAVAEAPPKTRYMSQASDEDVYAAKADRIAVYGPMGNVVAVIELVSPGNKNSRHAIRSFIEKALDLIGRGINLLIVDLFPPSRRDPQGIHKVIWDEVQEERFELPADKPLTMVAYSAGVPKKAYVEPVAVGDTLQDMPVFLNAATYILAPLEATYRATWETCPEPLREMILASAQTSAPPSQGTQ